MKIRVECRATVVVDVDVTARQLRQLDAGEIRLDDIVDESIPYRALREDGQFEFIEWDRARSQAATPRGPKRQQTEGTTEP